MIEISEALCLGKVGLRLAEFLGVDKEGGDINELLKWGCIVLENAIVSTMMNRQ